MIECVNSNTIKLIRKVRAIKIAAPNSIFSALPSLGLDVSICIRYLKTTTIDARSPSIIVNEKTVAVVPSMTGCDTSNRLIFQPTMKNGGLKMFLLGPDKNLSFGRQNFVMRIVEDKDGDKFLVFDDFEELKEIFIEACHELEYKNSNKNLSLDK